MNEAPEKKPIDPTKCTPAQAAELIGVEREWIEQDLTAGAPTNADGSINIVQFWQWCLSQE